MILKMATKLWTLRIYLLFLSLRNASSQFIENKLCISVCFCMPREGVIICNQEAKMAGIPTNVDLQIKSLTVQYGNFLHPTIYQRNLTGLSHLNYLKIIYCKLLSVDSRAFEEMKNLIELDLSHNNLQIIEPYTFSGLSLKFLHLLENPGLKLFPKSFSGMTAKSINLRSNKIKSIDFDTFSDTDYNFIYLYNNEITTIDEKFSESLRRSNSLIDLSGNPLNCSCDLKWLVPILKEKHKNPQLESQMKSVNFVCDYPGNLKGKDLKSLSDHDLSCPKARITTIVVAMGIPDTELTCIAVGNHNKAPGVRWNYYEPDNVRELSRTPLKRKSNYSGNQETSLSVKVKITEKLQAFTCSSWFEENQTENIVVNIKAPKISNKNEITTSRYVNKTEFKTKVFPDSHFIFKKQFTILEMIGAVIGTFIITLVLLVVLAQIYRWWKRGQKSETNYKSVNIIKPYWTLGHDSNNTYSHPISHTDYDFPRTYETEAPSMCQSPPLNRGEFLDYKTQNRIYS